ncbi:hypothetical protein ABCS02_13520 [Microbacterium sp. X-17]|uniref:hypothetical protein n=1 Tax=Microbacterium sp. X-17 TaxID=3144404 RepID=UPI0031F4F6D1
MSKPGRDLAHAVKALQGARDPLESLAAARDLREAAELAERDAVSAARAGGASWATIGKVYGLTKQGAQQRFKSPPAAEAAPAD